MRNLKKLLEKIYRKAALQLVKRGVEGPKPPPEEVITGVYPCLSIREFASVSHNNNHLCQESARLDSALHSPFTTAHEHMLHEHMGGCYSLSTGQINNKQA